MNLPPDQYELYAAFGMVAEKAQVLEVAVGNVALSFLTLFYKTDELSPDDRMLFRGVIDDLNSKTLGRLLLFVKSTGTFDDAILQVIDEALERRNYLMHQFFRRHNFGIFSLTGREQMIDELKEIRNKLALAETMLNAISESLDMLAGRGGVSESIADELRTKGRSVNI
jgi:hypothetical protein